MKKSEVKKLLKEAKDCTGIVYIESQDVDVLAKQICALANNPVELPLLTDGDMHIYSKPILPKPEKVGDDLRLRPAVQLFAYAMEIKLRENEHKGGWKWCDTSYLKNRLMEEVKEWGKNNDFMEMADVANFAMMIFMKQARSNSDEHLK